MYYEVYIDRLFCLNFWMNFLILRICAALLKEKINRRRFLLSCAILSAFDSIAICCIRFNGVFIFFVLQPVLCMLGAVCFFSFRGIRSLLRQTLLIVLVSMLFGGILTWLDSVLLLNGKSIRRITSILVISTVSYELLQYAVHKMKRRRCIEPRLYSVVLTHKDRSLSVRALLDTGNALIEPISKKPVCILQKKEAEKLCKQEEGMLLIPYRAVGTKSGILYGFTADSMKLINEGEQREIFKPIIGITDEKISIKQEYEMLLNPLLFC